MTDDVEAAFVDTLREQMEANERMTEVLEALCTEPDKRGTASRGDLEGMQRRIDESNRCLKSMARLVVDDIPADDRPSNWNAVLTMDD